MRIYLSGGFHSGWQDRILALDCICDPLWGYDFVDPRAHGLTDPTQYTLCDLAGIESADVLLVYLELENPHPYGLCVEVGYARALSKMIVLVDQCEDKPGFEMVRGCANVIVKTLDEAVCFLEKFRDVYRQGGNG